MSEKDKKMTFIGYKFENLSTLDTHPSQLSTEELATECEQRERDEVNTNVQFCSVFKTTLGVHSILMGAEVDCLESGLSFFCYSSLV